ncbi:J domain-containing protein [Mesoplasma syrphidae]|nr:DnaJ domain-containing protein [Mesoplasma syrphidae]
MENFVIIIGIFLTAFIALAIGTVILMKKNKIRSIEKQDLTAEINYFENNKKIWLFNTKTTVMIDTYKFSEVFDQFPFLSDFQESKAMMLKKRGASSTKIDKVVDDLLTHQSVILRQFQKSSSKLLKGFDKTKLKYNYQNANYLLKFYNIFLNCYKEQIVKNFVNKIMVVELNEVFKNISISYDKQEIIDKNLIRIEKVLNEAVDTILKKLYEDLSITEEQFVYTKDSDEPINNNSSAETYGKNFDQFELAYQVLGTTSDIDDVELKKAYRKLAMKYHPDKNSDAEANEFMSKINQAYELILKIRNLK